VVHEKHGLELEYTEVIKIIEQIRDVGTVLLAFSGGEVFLRDDILEIIEFASTNFLVILLSNGTLITPDVASRLKKLKVIQVEVSLYGGRAKTHDKVTGVAGSFIRTMDGLRALKKEQIPIVIKCTVMKENIDEGIYVKRIAEDLDARLKIGQLVVPKTDGSTEPLQYAIGDKDWSKYISRWIFQKPGVKRNSKKISGNPSMNGKELCTAGKAVCSISPHGIVHPCVILPWDLGSLREKSFEEIWQKEPPERLKWLRSLTFSDIKECKECNIRSFCTPCLGTNYLENRDILRCSANYCWQAHLWWADSPERKEVGL
jgi:radical SAM protein with 4Fe4S-binding SPASM domain